MKFSRSRDIWKGMERMLHPFPLSFFMNFGTSLSGNLIVRKDGPAEAENCKDYAQSAHANNPTKRALTIKTNSEGPISFIYRISIWPKHPLMQY